MWSKTALISLGLALAVLAQDAKKDPEEEKKKEEEAKAKLAEFRKDLKSSKTDADFGRATRAPSTCPCSRATTARLP